MTVPESKEIYKDYLDIVHKKPADVAPVWRISVYALVEREGKYLFIKQMHNHRWELPGGGVEISESLHEGVLREVYEETGYRVQAEEQPFYIGEKNFFGTRDQKYFRAIALMYRAKLTSEKQDKQVINTIVEDEISDVAWLDIADVKENNCLPLFWPVVCQLQL